MARINVRNIVSKDLWKRIGNDLRGRASDWWKSNQAAIVGMGKDELHEIAIALKAKDVKRAQMAILSRLDPNDPEDWKVWVSFRDGTTKRLRAAAARRKRMLDALEELGRVAAKIVGVAVLAAIGL